MKKYPFLLIALTCATLSCFAAEVVNVMSLTQSDFKEIMEGKHPDLAVAFEAETKLPVTFYLTGDLVSLAENHKKWGTVEIKQTFYGRFVEGELLLSSNLTDWKPFLEFITGNAGVSVDIENGTPSITVGAETNRRS